MKINIFFITKHKKSYIKFVLEMSSYVYDRQFSGNILVIGQTGCAKATFFQNLAKNNMFGRIKKS